jgi:uncharacterized membrane protein
MMLGGFAAPLFLWLAGLSAVLSADRTLRLGNSRTSAMERVCRRGLEIFILAFLFRVQSFVVSPGGPLVKLFRVDILNVMGPGIVAAALLWGLGRTTRGAVVAFVAAATACAMVTPIVRASNAVDAWPIWLQWYLRPAGENTTFTIFPWAGFVFAGGAVGAVFATASDDRAQTRRHAVLAVAGVGLTLFGLVAATRPSIYRESSFWTTSPTWFAIRVGILTVGLAVIYGVARVATRAGVRFNRLERMGRSSLFVYWIHVELVYGYASWSIRGRLPLPGTMLAFLVFSGLMYGAIVQRDRIIESWKRRAWANDRSMKTPYLSGI